MNKDYWEEFYKNIKVETEPSSFAKYIADNFLQQKERLIELGCGNGRDSFFFVNLGIKVVAVDQCSKNILFLKSYDKSLFNFISADFTQLSNIGTFNYVYSRWTIHTINEKQENKVLKWTYDSLEKNGKYFIEARGLKNELYKVGEPVEGEDNAFYYDNHYRRFINRDILCQKLKHIGFTILSNEEEKFKDEKQNLIRVICEKLT